MWRQRKGELGSGALPPEPWPSRVEAFMTACALTAGHREDDTRSLLRVIEGLGGELRSTLGGKDG